MKYKHFRIIVAAIDKLLNKRDGYLSKRVGGRSVLVFKCSRIQVLIIVLYDQNTSSFFQYKPHFCNRMVELHFLTNAVFINEGIVAAVGGLENISAVSLILYC